MTQTTLNAVYLAIVSYAWNARIGFIYVHQIEHIYEVVIEQLHAYDDVGVEDSSSLHGIV